MHPEYVNRKGLRDFFGVDYSISQINNKIRAGDFPAPALRLSGRRPLWRYAEVKAWLEQQSADALPVAQRRNGSQPDAA